MGKSMAGRGGAVFAALFFAAALVCSVSLLSCDNGGSDFINRQFVPVGEWEDGYGSGYNITKGDVEYYTPDFGEGYPPTDLKGTIVDSVDFSEGSGVLIIKITSYKENDADATAYTVGDYTGVYYKDYTDAHMYLANAIDSTTYAGIQVDSLGKALKTFNEANVGIHVSSWGSGYNAK